MRLVRQGVWGAWLAALVLAGCHSSKEKQGPPQGGPGAGQAMPVEVLELRPGPVRETGEYLGTLISRRSITVFPQVAGYVQRIVVKPGDRVKQGQLLLEVDPRRERAGVQSAQAQRNSALAQRQYALSTRKRAEELLREGLMSRQDYEQAVAQAAAAEASARAAEAQLEAQRVQLGYYLVQAPFDGVVGDIPVKRGDYVTSQTALTNVDQSRALEVSVQVPPERASEVEVGRTPVEVLDTEGKLVVSAPVFFVAPTPDPRTQLVEVKAAFDNTVGLRAGMVVHARVVYDTRESLRLPSFAAMQQSSQFFAMVAAQGDAGTTIAQRRPVKLGELQDNYYEVLGGLDAGTPVIVGSLQQLRDGQPIQPKPVRQLPGEEQGVGGAGDAGTGGTRDAGTGPNGGR
ncbi:efflux RND transporter periplasmic adaptor subunit [Vitiosangium sp. GDMCC 1.1324]|uniref:efflux RND transporter periplasmic adaptor subunit n=1 Tax=Vitiosangium sp. (strain GDMCC 1.1324) TaxID=2138576 RepID=UPI000D347CCB|nr:efflux RND transporter periplasmic adaptor subunit [Vitiosangium sp. GDMCC 1.1324]PTL81618.1 efflux RND transporter periplasmic adaptor subunit [Vitiosangium sp. GDMCC 1.1324]